MENDNILNQIIYDEILEDAKPEKLMQCSLTRRNLNEKQDDHLPSKEGNRRTKERKIGQVVGLVNAWREMHYEKRMSLEEAANSLKISKKSLDDYYNQIKFSLFFLNSQTRIQIQFQL